MYKMNIKMPMMPQITFHVMLLSRYNFPNVGDITWVYRAFDPKTGEIVTSSGAPVGKGCVLAVPGQPNRCVFHSIDAIFGWQNAFLLDEVVAVLHSQSVHQDDR